MPQVAERVRLKSETLHDFDLYICEAEAAMEQTLHGATPFLWCDANSERAQEVRQGKILAQANSLSRNVPFGLGWLIEPIIQELPKESLINTLNVTLQALTRHEQQPRPLLSKEGTE
jgi:hypothetical protein